MNKKKEERDEPLGRLLQSITPPEYDGSFEETVRGLLAGAKQESPGKRKRRMVVGGSGILAVAAAVAAAVLLVPNDATRKPGDVAIPTSVAPTPSTSEPSLLLASQVAEKSQSVLRSATSLSGTLELHEAAGTSKKNFVITAAGDFRVAGTDAQGRKVDESYEAKTQKYVSSYDGTYFTATGPSDGGIWSVPSSSVDFLRQISWSVDQLADDDSATLSDAEVDGQPVWRLKRTVDRATPLEEPDALTVDVDQKTSLPIKVDASRRGKTLFQANLLDVHINEAPSASFAIAVPTGAAASELVRFQQTTATNARSLAGYDPVSPSFIPDGFVSSGVQYAPEYFRTEEMAGGEKILSQSFKRSFETIDVSTSRIPDYAATPYRLIVNASTVETVTLSSGRFAGITVKIEQPGILQQRVLWGMKDGLVFVVSGTVSNAELVSIANGLR